MDINGVYWGCNPFTNHLLTSWDIQVVRPDVHISSGFWCHVHVTHIHHPYPSVHNMISGRFTCLKTATSTIPIPSMVHLPTFWLIFSWKNVGKYSIHGMVWEMKQILCPLPRKIVTQQIIGISAIRSQPKIRSKRSHLKLEA